MLLRMLLVLPSSLVLACSGTPRSTTSPATTSAPSTSPTAAAATEARPPVAAQTKRVVVTLGRPSGSSVMTTAADGTITTVFDVLENGRGPHAEATIAL